MTQKTKKRSVGAMITGTIISGAILSAGSVNAAEMFSFNDLGSGAELRSELLDDATTGMKAFEATCGDKKASSDEKASSDDKAAEHKCGEGKCGEGKCGEEGKASDKASKKASMKTSEKATESTSEDKGAVKMKPKATEMKKAKTTSSSSKG